MTKGKVKWYDKIKGFGFIVTEDGDDVFVHRSGLVNSYEGLQDDQEVVFNIKESDKGQFATDVKVEQE